jgi:hypothetical protein
MLLEVAAVPVITRTGECVTGLATRYSQNQTMGCMKRRLSFQKGL